MATNVFLVRWAAGWTERTHASSVTELGRIEAPLELGALASVAEAGRVADAELEEFARERVQTDAGIDGDDAPYEDFDVGDLIGVDGDPHRVLGVTVRETAATGRALFTLHLDTIIVFPMERVAQAFRKMLLGTLAGRSGVAQPVDAAVASRGLVSVFASLPQALRIVVPHLDAAVTLHAPAVTRAGTGALLGPDSGKLLRPDGAGYLLRPSGEDREE